MKKQRIDQRLVDEGYFTSRDRAKRAVMAGIVYLEEERIEKPGTKVAGDKPIQVKGSDIPYVGRGGLKMEKALQVFHLQVADKIILDIGASTGGFTDCCLQNGAQLVYALDVGYNQLAWKLRNDKRVIVQERYNFRYAQREDFQMGQPQVAVIDVSFISLSLMLPVLRNILQTGGDCVALIKPQFEVTRDKVGKKGIVSDSFEHEQVIDKVLQQASDLGFRAPALTYSPITGGYGNIEYLLHLQFVDDPAVTRSIDISKVVAEAFTELRRL